MASLIKLLARLSSLQISCSSKSKTLLDTYVFIAIVSFNKDLSTAYKGGNIMRRIIYLLICLVPLLLLAPLIILAAPPSQESTPTTEATTEATAEATVEATTEATEEATIEAKPK